MFSHIKYLLNKCVKRGIKDDSWDTAWTGWVTDVLCKLLIFPLKSKAKQFISFLCQVMFCSTSEKIWGCLFHVGLTLCVMLTWLYFWHWKLKTKTAYVRNSAAFLSAVVSKKCSVQCKNTGRQGIIFLTSVILINISHDTLLFRAKTRGCCSSAVINITLCGLNP